MNYLHTVIPTKEQVAVIIKPTTTTTKVYKPKPSEYVPRVKAKQLTEEQVSTLRSMMLDYSKMSESVGVINDVDYFVTKWSISLYLRDSSAIG